MSKFILFHFIYYSTKLRNDRNDASTIEELLKNMQEIVSPSPENLNDVYFIF